MTDHAPLEDLPRRIGLPARGLPRQLRVVHVDREAGHGGHVGEAGPPARLLLLLPAAAASSTLGQAAVGHVAAALGGARLAVPPDGEASRARPGHCHS